MRSRRSSAPVPDRALSIGRPAIALLQAQGIPADASTNLVGRRPDIAALALARRSRCAAHQGSARRFYPNVNLVGSDRIAVLRARQSVLRRLQLWKRRPRGEPPLFHGGALQGQYRGRRGQYDEAVALYDAQVIKALRETADAVTSQKMLVRRLGESRSALAAFEEAHRLARLRYEQGPRDLSRRADRRGGRRPRAAPGRPARDPRLHPRRAAGPRPRRRIHGCLTPFNRRHNMAERDPKNCTTAQSFETVEVEERTAATRPSGRSCSPALPPASR